MVNCSCADIITYKKTDASEVIQPGDILMLDLKNATVTKAVITNYREATIDSRLVIGVCVSSNNSESLPYIINGGYADTTEAELLNGGVSKRDGTETIIVISGPDSTQNKRELVKVAYTGEQVVNICGYVDIGDKLCISEHAGKAKSKNYFEKEYFGLRSIGKVVKRTNTENQVKVLLDIE